MFLHYRILFIISHVTSAQLVRSVSYWFNWNTASIVVNMDSDMSETISTAVNVCEVMATAQPNPVEVWLG